MRTDVNSPGAEQLVDLGPADAQDAGRLDRRVEQLFHDVLLDSAECEPALTPGRPLAEALSHARQKRATAGHRCSPGAPRARHHRATSLPSAAQGSEARPTRSGRSARGARRACWGPASAPSADAQAAARPGQGGGAPSGCGKRRNAPAARRTASAGTWRFGHPAPSTPPQRPRRSRNPARPSPWPTRKPDGPASPVADLTRAPPSAWADLAHPGGAPENPPQHIGTQLSLYPGPGIMRHMPAPLPRPFPVRTTRGTTRAVPEDPRDGPDRRLVR